MSQLKPKTKGMGQAREIWRRFRKNKTAMLGFCVFAFIILVALFADVIVPYEQAINQTKDLRLATPSGEHWFGGDNLGRDIFARIVHGSRVSISVGLVVTLISLAISSVLGGIAGYYGGLIDNIIMRILDVIMCVPQVLLALSIVAALGPSLVNLFIALTISSIPGTVRLVRSTILTVADLDYIEAARNYGASDARIISKYIIPNAIGPVIINATVGMANLILAAASLSFLGMGVQPPTPEWGSMLSNAREFLRTAPHLLYFPGIAIMLTALSINLVGDGLRDALDPKLRN